MKTLTREEARVLDALGASHPIPMSVAEIASATRRPETETWRALDHLRDQGRVSSTRLPGVYSTLWTLR